MTSTTVREIDQATARKLLGHCVEILRAFDAMAAEAVRRLEDEEDDAEIQTSLMDYLPEGYFMAVARTVDEARGEGRDLRR